VPPTFIRRTRNGVPEVGRSFSRTTRTLRLVADGKVAGAVLRIAAEGEWRTNIALGGVRQPVVEPPHDASRIALSAARALSGTLVAVDLMKDEHDAWTVIEINGAAEFTSEYLPRGDVFGAVVSALDSSALRAIGQNALLRSPLWREQGQAFGSASSL
jgi:hypothetical protein